MNIIECHVEFGGFSDDLIKGGISVYLWNLCRQFRSLGHQVSALTAAHGLLPVLRERYEVHDLDWSPELAIPVPLDPQVWPEHGPHQVIEFRPTAHRIRVAGVDIVLLAGGLLDAYPNTFYPPYEAKGRDLAFLKPLVFQVCASRFLIDQRLTGSTLHLHEPFYHYLMPAVLAEHGMTVVSTVQANMPVNKKVYGPEVRALLAYLGADPAVAGGLQDPPLDAPLHRVMRAYLPRTSLYNDYPERPGHDYLPILGLTSRAAAAVDFLSPGQLRHVITQRDTPFEQLYTELAVSRELRARPERLTVGGCAIGDRWRTVEQDYRPRERVLAGLGLDPALFTVYHNARYAIGHKGQRELFTALLRLLDGGAELNVLLHCLNSGNVEDEDLLALAKRFPGQVRVSTEPMPEAELIDWACAADACLYPSKYEMDTFLMAMGEAMSCGAVPIATAQLGMLHFEQRTDLADPAATGKALPRSFRADDPLLVAALVEAIEEVRAVWSGDPERWAELRRRSRAVAREFSWERAARRLAEVFEAAASGRLPLPEPAQLIRLGRADLIGDEQARALDDATLAEAGARGELDLVRRARPGREPDLDGMLALARDRGDVGALARIVAATGSLTGRALLDRRGSASWGDGGLRVDWGLVTAARIEACWLTAAGELRLEPLTAWSARCFTATIPADRFGAPAPDGIALLITLPDGRSVWDELPVRREGA
ncbi:MAG TPA: hypothetical protein VMB79_03185 [Jatrophihabitans sp.]|nr:hypothetical protein [Jatrophihabitans sp.]